jgi:6-phosphogluconolactonase
VGKLDTTRITLMAPVFNDAARMIFLVAGEDMAMALKSVRRGPFEPAQLPAELIRPVAGELFRLVDRAAAARLGPARGAP